MSQFDENLPAPTLAELVDRHANLTLECPDCRVLTQLQLSSLCPRFPAGTRVDRIRFHCERVRKGRRCGARLQLDVKGPGNSLIGFPQIWPPARAPQDA